MASVIIDPLVSGPSEPQATDRIVRVDADLAKHRLDRLLALALPDLSRSRLKQLIESGQVVHAGRTLLEPATHLPEGSDVRVRIPAPVAAEPLGQDIPLSVVYEDGHVIVIDKPAGLVVHPAAGNPDGTLVNALIAHCGPTLQGIGGETRPGIVHRIDKDTSGLIIAAKTELAHRSLGRQFAAHVIERVYHAIVWGCPRVMQGTIEGNIARSPANRQKMAMVHSGGKFARTHYQVERVFGARGRAVAAHLTCRLETGRTHQVRVHLAHLGHPLIGDAVYGRARHLAGVVIPIQRQALHAAVLGFQHPATHKPIRFESPLPPDFLALIAVLEGLGESTQ